MDKIKSLTQSCLTKQPKLNNIPQLLLQLIATQYSDQDKLFIANQLTNVFIALHQRGKFDNQTNKFIQEKRLLLLGILLQFTTVNKRFESHVSLIVNISEAREIVDIAKENKFVWGNITNYNKVIEVLNEVTKENSLIQIECLLNICEINYQELSGQNQQLQQQLENKFKKSFQSVLFSVLKDNSLDDNTYKSLVQSFAQKIFPRIGSPLNLSQHICHKYSQTKNLELKISLLSCLFILIGKYGLELQNFYDELFNLIQMRNEYGQSVFQVSNSKKVLKMVENSLRSSKVAFNVLVKFIKELVNRCLFQNTSFVCWVMALSFNLIKKHQLLNNCLNPQSEMYIHEFGIIQNHFMPQIQNLIKKLGKNLNKQDFLDIAEFSTIDLQKALRYQMENLSQAKILIPTIIEDLLL